MEKKTAIVIGATGLIGRHLTELLLENPGYGIVKVFARRPVGVESPKLEEHLVDFDAIQNWKDRVTGDELFSTLGTTRKHGQLSASGNALRGRNRTECAQDETGTNRGGSRRALG